MNFFQFRKFVFFSCSFFESLHLEKKWFSSLMRIPCGIFGTEKLMKVYQKCPFAYSTKFNCAGADLGRSRLV